MKTNFRKLLSMLLVLVMFISMIPAVSAEGEVTEVASSADLVAALKAGGDIKLTGSFTLSALAEVPAGVTVTLDLNGKTITTTSGSHYINNKGTLTIQDTLGGGKITAASDTSTTYMKAVRSEGTLNIAAGTFTSEAKAANAYAIYVAGGTATITGGTFTANQKATASENKHAYGIGVGGGANLRITGGDFTANSTNTKSSRVTALVIESAAQEIIIEGGTFTGNRTADCNVSASAIRRGAAANITIKAGTFTASGKNQVLIDSDSGTLNIEGGAFKTDGTVFDAAPTTVTGGTFTNAAGTEVKDISTYVSDGFEQSEDGSVVAQQEITLVATEEAFFAAVAGTSGTVNIKLTGDFAITQTTTADTSAYMIKSGRTVVLDLNGHTISSTQANNSYIRNAGNLTIKDTKGGGKISVSATGGSGRCVRNTGTLTIESGLYEIATEKQHAYAIWTTGGTLIINGGTFDAKQTSNSNTSTSAFAIGMQDSFDGDVVLETANVTINNGTFTATNHSSHHSSRVAPLYVEKGSSVVTVKDGRFEATRVDHDVIVSSVRVSDRQTPVFNIEGGTFAMNGSTQQVFDIARAELNISGGTFTTTGSVFGTSTPKPITGGKFVDGNTQTAYDVSDYVAEGYQQLADGTVGALIEVNTEDAFFAALAKSGMVVKLTGDIELTKNTTSDSSAYMVKAGTTVVIDLNGHTITTNKADTSYIRNAGNLTIKDSSEEKTGKISAIASSGSGRAIRNTGTLIIESGTFSSTSASQFCYAIWSTGGTVIINGGTLEAKFTGGNVGKSAYAIGSQDGAQITINDGTFTATTTATHKDSRVAALYVEAGSPSFTVNGGTFSGTRQSTAEVETSAVRFSGSGTPKLTINKGDFSATGGYTVLFVAEANALTIKDGSFSTAGTMFNNSPASITGGRFLTSGNMYNVSDYVAEGYAQMDNGTVVLATNLPDVVKVGTTAYKSVWEAAAKSGSGDTITLIADAKATTEVSLAEGVILDLNGCTLEAPAVFGSDSQIVDSKQNGLLKIPEGFATLNPDNSQLPLWDATAGGYRMANTKIQVKAGTSGVFYFRFDLTNADWEQLLPQNEISLLVRVDGYSETYKANQQWLDMLYADTTGRGAIKVTFLNAPAQMDIQVSVASNVVEVSKATNSTALAPLSPSGTVDPVASDVRAYLAAATERYEGATLAELAQMTSVKATGQNLYTSKQPITLSWRWDESVPADSQFVIELSLTEDFADSQILACNHFNPNYTVQSEPFWNPMMATTYYWRVVATLTEGQTVEGATMSFTTEAGPRLMYVPGVDNVRDLGGWETSEIVLSDGTILPAGAVAQGLVYRSALLEKRTAEGERVLLEEMGIKTEIELRQHYASGAGDLAKKVEGVNLVIDNVGDGGLDYVAFIENPTNAKLFLEPFTKQENYPIIFHCHYGADRTGSLAFILNALQGVSTEDLIKDYEFTNLRYLQGSANVNVRGFLTAFDALEGDTPYEKARTFCLSAGLTDTQIDQIILLMRGQ